MIWLVAMLATTLTTIPIIFQHMSFVSPNNGGTFLFYDHLPTLPGYSSKQIGVSPAADVGAMMWQHFPSVVAQERSIKQYNEFPLWNRYHSSGTSMIGQGQLMLGDPLNWLTWIFGTNAYTFDIKFILLRIIFAASLGLSVLVITRQLIPASMVTFLSPFIGFLAFRINHPEIFTLCYSPLIMLAWFKLIYSVLDVPRLDRGIHEQNRERVFRLRWVIFLLVANWLVLNSGTVKEAYMSIICLNAMGFVNFVLERQRFGQQFKQRMFLLVATGFCFVMIATPIWATFLHEVINGTSFYTSAVVEQRPFWQLLGFADNLYYLLATDHYFPSINVCLFAGMILGVVGSVQCERSEYQKAYLVLVAGVGALVALIYGVVPSFLLINLPFVKNIYHIDTTFSIVLIVPACILAGVGFAWLAEHENQTFIPMILLSLLLGLYGLNAPHLANVKYWNLAAYMSVLLISAGFLPLLMIQWIQSRLNLLSTSICLLLLLLVIGNMAMFSNSAKSFASKPVFNPQQRATLRIQPELITRILTKIEKSPQRVVGLGNVLFPGFNAAFGLENICSPQAMFDKRYLALTRALNMPYTAWGWRMLFESNQLKTYKNSLDFLNVGMILSPEKSSHSPDMKYFANDDFLYAFTRKDVWPRAFFTNHIIGYESLDEFAQQINKRDSHPFVALDHDMIKQNITLQTMLRSSSMGKDDIVNATDYDLTNNTTHFTVNVNVAPGIIYLGEAGDPDDFIVTVNNQIVPSFTANYAFKGILIEKPGLYRVNVEYWPAHFTQYLMLSILGIMLWSLILFFFWIKNNRHRSYIIVDHSHKDI